MTYRPCRGTNLVILGGRRSASKAYSSGSVVGAQRIRRKTMFNGNLINELISIVARVEEKAQRKSDAAELEPWYSLVTHEAVKYETNLLGVA